jgi:hypothetical protein
MATAIVTPRQLMANLMGPGDRVDRWMDRVTERNKANGQDDAVVWHRGDYREQMDRPWLMFRDADNGLFQGHHSGYSDSLRRSLFLNAESDPYYFPAGGKANRVMSSIPLNTAAHEAIHSAIHGDVPSNDWYKLRAELPGDIDRDGMEWIPDYLSQHKAELDNLIMHTKRLHELTDPDMRDIGNSEDSVSQWFDHIDSFQRSGKDPIINLPGHINEGQPAHGLENQSEWLQEIRNRMQDWETDDYMRDSAYKTAQSKPSIKGALLG